MLSTSKLLATLKSHKPAKVRAYVGEDERDIAIPKVRKWAARVVTNIDGLGAWSRVEMLDKSGALLATVDNADPASDLQDITGNGNSVPAQVERMVNVTLRATEKALAFRNEEMQALLRAQGDVVKELTAGMRALSGLYQEQVSAARELATIQAEAKVAPEGSDMQQLLEALPTIMQALPAIRAMLGAGAPAAAVRPKNGA